MDSLLKDNYPMRVYAEGNVRTFGGYFSDTVDKPIYDIEITQIQKSYNLTIDFIGSYLEMRMYGYYQDGEYENDTVFAINTQKELEQFHMDFSPGFDFPDSTIVVAGGLLVGHFYCKNKELIKIDSLHYILNVDLQCEYDDPNLTPWVVCVSHEKINPGAKFELNIITEPLSYKNK